jgi:hypothetical protein
MRKDEAASPDIHLVFILKDVISFDPYPVDFGVGKEPSQMRDVKPVSAAGDFSLGGGDEPPRSGNITLGTLAQKGNFLGNLKLDPFVRTLNGRKGRPADGLGFG